ncbi:MAG TPA: response regulator [Terriglobales bacterium]|nr:response regulator [Terriglobales bacterium]
MSQKLFKRLLFVDDEPSIRATLPLVLQQHGFDVTAAATVPEAIQKIQHQPFEALLSDLNIAEPGDGFAVVRAMRQVNPQCVAVILTGYPGFDTAVEGIRENIDDYIVKPVEIDVLVASMEHNLAQRRIWQQLRTGTE